MSVSANQKAQILILSKQGLSAPEIGRRLGLGTMVVAGVKAVLTRAKGTEKHSQPAGNASIRATTKRGEYKRRFGLADETEKWAVTMAKVGIRQAVGRAPWPRWQFATFCGPHGGEARGIVDLIAVRKDHGNPRPGLKRGDAFQMVLIQVKGGQAAKPTQGDGERLRIVQRLYRARHVVLATWKRGEAASFYSLREKPKQRAAGWHWQMDWEEITDLNAIFG